MKRIIILTIIGFCLTNCSHKLTSFQLNDYDSVEGINIGMSLSKAIEKSEKKYFVEKTERLVYEGEKEQFDYIVYEDKNKKEVLFSFNGGNENQDINNVFRILIKNPKYTTPEGISVGMTMKDLKEKAELKSAYFNYDDGLFILSEKFDGGYWMEVETAKYMEYNFDESKINSLPEGLKIKAIIIF